MAKLREQFNIGNVIALIGLLLTSGFFTWSGRNAGEIITDITVNSMKFNKSVDSIATAKVDSLIRSGIITEIRDSLMHQFSEDDGQHLFDEIKTNNKFASDLIDELDDMTAKDVAENHKKMKEFFDKGSEQVEYCDRIIPKDGRPKLYQPCEGFKVLPIMYGFPDRLDGRRYRHAVYYVKLNGSDYVLNRISNVILDG